MPIDCASTPLVLAAKSPSPSAARGLSQPCAGFCPWPSCAASARPAPPAFPGASSAGFSLFLISLRSSSASFSEASWLESCCSSQACWRHQRQQLVYPDAASEYRLPRRAASQARRPLTARRWRSADRRSIRSSTSRRCSSRWVCRPNQRSAVSPPSAAGWRGYRRSAAVAQCPGRPGIG